MDFRRLKRLTFTASASVIAILVAACGSTPSASTCRSTCRLTGGGLPTRSKTIAAWKPAEGERTFCERGLRLLGMDVRFGSRTWNRERRGRSPAERETTGHRLGHRTADRLLFTRTGMVWQTYGSGTQRRASCEGSPIGWSVPCGIRLSGPRTANRCS